MRILIYSIQLLWLETKISTLFTKEIWVLSPRKISGIIRCFCGCASYLNIHPLLGHWMPWEPLEPLVLCLWILQPRTPYTITVTTCLKKKSQESFSRGSQLCVIFCFLFFFLLYFCPLDYFSTSVKMKTNDFFPQFKFHILQNSTC